MDKGKLETSCAPMAIIKRVLWKIGAVWPLCILIFYIIQIYALFETEFLV